MTDDLNPYIIPKPQFDNDYFIKGVAMDTETHNVCNNRLAKEGGEARCCDCEPHEGCNLKELEE